METSEVLRTFIRESFFVENFDDAASFLRTGIIDSMGMLQLVAFVEDRFEIELTDDEIVPANFDSLAQLTAFIERRRKRQTA